MHKSIAVIGMGCIFPDAMDISEYWSNIVYGKDSIREIPDAYWLLEDYYDYDPKKKDKTYSKKAGVVEDIPFNPMEFGIMPKDLESISVEQLFALVVAKQALIDARMYGKNARNFDREKVGVILASGIGKTAFSLNTRLQIPKFRKILRNSGVSEELTEKVLGRIADSEIDWTENSNPGYLPNVVAGRVASRFNLYGTNCTVDAACASSFAALKYAVSELEAGDCDIMLTGAVNLDCSEFSFVSFSKTPAISRTDNIKPFDQDSDGMILGDGVGMVVLKRLEDAERDGDRIYGVIKGVGASGDGKAKGIFAPNVDGQIKALKRAYENANVNPASVTLIEAHGTGTKVGDEYELEALKTFFGEGYKNHYIGIGSVKSQIGHTRLASGIASFIKVMLALYHNVLPVTLNVDKVSTIIKNTQFNVINNTKPWIVNEETPVRRAGISAFGFGGTNYHVVVEEYKDEQEQAYRLNNVPKTIVISGRTNEEIIEKCQSLKERLLADGEVDFDSCYEEITLKIGGKRIGFVANNEVDAIRKLDSAVELLRLNNEKSCWETKEFYYRDRSISNQGKIVTLFTNYQSPKNDMFHDVAINYPEMRECFTKADNERIQHGKKPISQLVYPFIDSYEYEENELQKEDNAALVSATISCGIYKILKNRGVKSDYFVGSESGEMVSLWANGVIDEEELFHQSFQDCPLNYSMETSISDAYKKGGRIFIQIGSDKKAFNKVRKLLGVKEIEWITIDNDSSENSYEELEYALMKLRVLGVAIEPDIYYKKQDDEIKLKFEKHSIRINPRIYRSNKKEKIVREAIYKNIDGEFSDAKQEKLILHASQKTEKNVGKINTIDCTLDEIVRKPQKKDFELLYKIGRMNHDAFNFLLNSQKSQFDFFFQALDKHTVIGENKNNMVKSLYTYGEKNLIAYNEYILKQYHELQINQELEIDQEENFVTVDKQVGMRVMDVAIKKVTMQPREFILKKGLVIVTLDRDEVAIKICKELEENGFIPIILNIEGVEADIKEYPLYNIEALHEQDILKTIEKIITQHSLKLTGFIHIATLSYDKTLNMYREFEINKAIFLIAKYFYLYSDKDLKEDEKKFFINVLRMDGFLGTKGTAPNIMLGGLFGLGKSLCDEWKDTLVKTIDIQRECDNKMTVKYIMEELQAGDSSCPEVGRDIDGERYSLGLNNIKRRKFEHKVPCSEDVFLVTGGGRGITAKCIINLAKTYHCKFVILGRTVLKNELKLGRNFKTKKDLQKAIIEQMRRENKKCTPKEVSENVNSYYAQMKILETMETLKGAGSQVLYYACDVMNESEVKNIVKEIESKVGEITGFIHGAGVLADKYIYNKNEEDFYVVAGTKIYGLLSCLNSINMDKIKFLIFFSSVAAFFGNRGQSDYAIGNEVLNKMSYKLKKLYPSCKVVSINWGPWDGGMIDSSLKRSLADRDISVIPIDEGIEFFMEQFRYEQEENVSQVVVYDKSVF